MGRATNAILAYGYDLGGPDAGWRVQETDRWGQLADLPWYDPAEESNGGPYLPEAALAALKAVGTEDGITIATYCCETAPSYILSANTITVRRGDVETINPVHQLTMATAGRAYTAQLAHALKVLGLTPLADEPAWHLASYWENG